MLTRSLRQAKQICEILKSQFLVLTANINFDVNSATILDSIRNLPGSNEGWYIRKHLSVPYSYIEIGSGWHWYRRCLRLFLVTRLLLLQTSHTPFAYCEKNLLWHSVGQPYIYSTCALRMLYYLEEYSYSCILICNVQISTHTISQLNTINMYL